MVRDRYEAYDGFVVLHGTDTMAYTTSALSFMLSGLSKPVIFTGSQLPIGHLRTDAKENLITSIELASLTGEDGQPVVREVCLYFQHELYRGNRCTKINAEQFSAFASPNYPPLAHSGVHLTVDQGFALAAFLRVLFAGCPPGDPNPDAAHLPRYPRGDGALPARLSGLARRDPADLRFGNAPDSAEFLAAIEHVIARDIPVVNITQCIKGAVNQGDYQVSESLLRARGNQRTRHDQRSGSGQDDAPARTPLRSG